jgi:hypothetical protein
VTRSGARFLVVVRAGDTSLHPHWTRNLATRDWDLVVSYFGNDPERFRDPGETRIDDKGQKWSGLHALLMREDFWRGYDYIWLPDDDLAIEQDIISMLFQRVSAMGLMLAQPALSWTSYYSHRITLVHPSFTLRMTNFVEVMAPCFARPFLERCLPTFTENLSGWGIDVLWPRMLPPTPRSCAIIDALPMTHTRPVGGPNYDKLREAGLSAADEADALMMKYGIPLDSRAMVYLGIDREGRILDAADSAGKEELRRLLAADRAAFADAVAQNIILDGNARSTSAR